MWIRKQVKASSLLHAKTRPISHPSLSSLSISPWTPKIWCPLVSWLLASIAAQGQKVWKISQNSLPSKVQLAKILIIRENSITVIIIDSKLILIEFCEAKTLARPSWSDTSPTSTPRRCSWRRLTRTTAANTTFSTFPLTWRTTAMLDMPLSTLSIHSLSYHFMRTSMESRGRDSTPRKSAKSPMEESRASRTLTTTSPARLRIGGSSL